MPEDLIFRNINIFKTARNIIVPDILLESDNTSFKHYGLLQSQQDIEYANDILSFTQKFITRENSLMIHSECGVGV
ncbi:hypothetical protein GF312_12700 [Candidatus Poribacteria bacterium]|nr:hypothetical protein [Candidatus Poribacteria bacterium]